MVDLQSYDFLIAFSVSTAVPDEKPDKQLSSTNAILMEDTPTYGRVIEICWSVYDIKKQIVCDEVECLVKPYKFHSLSPATVKKTGITNEDMISHGTVLSEVLRRFNENIYMNYVMNNATFCLVTFGDDVLTKILPHDAKEIGIKLPNHFLTYFDIITEFRKCYKFYGTLGSINEYLAFLKLGEKPAKTSGSLECKSILRIIHRMAKDGHRFQQAKVLNPQHQLINETAQEVSRDYRLNKKWSTFIRSRSPESFRNPSKTWYIRLRGLPYTAREPEIIEFLRGIRVYKEDIVFYYDYEGKFTGEAYVQLHNEADYKEALSYTLSDIGNRFVEVFETNENEYNKARLSQYPEKREIRPEVSQNWAHLLQDHTGIIKMRGLPYSCTEGDIREFFRNLNIMEGGIKRPIIGGKASGECFVVFETKEEAYAALNLNMEKIGNRFIELFLSNNRELENFLIHNFTDSGPTYSKEHLPNIPLDKRKSTVIMMGLPFNTNKNDILNFLGGFNLKEHDIHLLPGHSGKFSGNALVTFEDELEAQRAIKTKNLTYINNRYIELSEYR